MKQLLTLLVVVLTSSPLHSQSDTVSAASYEGLSLKDLLEVRIVSVSKTSESLFDAPLSASVVTKEEIQRSGSTSIMEALRLVPGMIVREQANGSYDIHLRGMDNVPPNAPFDVTSNTTTLVMIDNRPIYSYLRGGTFWETVPVDINDVEKIEVVRGPAAALYGPNAVNGVINIITLKAETNGAYTVVNSRYGSQNTFIQNASVGYRINRWSAIASGNFQSRDRSQLSYFEYNRNRWIDTPSEMISFNDDTFYNINERYPHPEKAMEKYAGNLFVSYDRGEKLQFSLSAGAQHSLAQKVSVENEITALSTAASTSKYVNVRGDIKALSGQFAYNQGTQNIDHDPGNKYRFSILDANMEYAVTAGEFSIKPGLSYRRAVYDDTPYSDTSFKAGIFNARGEISTKSAFLRSEYRLLRKKVRLVAGISANSFNYPDTTYIAYEFAATYKLSKKHLFRAVYSKSPRSSTVFDTYVNQSVSLFPIGYKKSMNIALQGNKDLRLLTADMLEFGYRGNIARKLDVDIELFDIHARNFSTLVSSQLYTEMRGTDTIVVMPITSTNLPAKISQHGLTASLNYKGEKFQLRPFITVQKTVIRDYAPSNTGAGMGPVTIYSGIGNKSIVRSTPAWFGGMSANYLMHPKWNINMSAYAYASQTYYHLSNLLFNDGVRGIDHIGSKVIVNTNISYEPVKSVKLFCTAKNLLNQTGREFFRTDEVPFMLLGGVTFELSKK